MHLRTSQTSQLTVLARLNNLFAIVLLAAVSAGVLAQSAQAQYLAWPPGERDEGLMNCAPENCIAYMSVAGTGQYDATANPTEAWISQPEIQASIKKLVAATMKFSKKNSSNSPAGRLLFSQSPADFLKQPMAFFLSSIANKEDIDGNQGALLVKLGELEARAEALLKATLAEADLKTMTKEIDDAKYYVVESTGNAPTVSFGIVDNYFILTFGRLPLTDVVESLKTPPPAWLTELDKRIAIDRPAFTTYINFESLKSLLENFTDAERKDFDKLDAIYHFTEFQTLQFQNGMNANGFNQIGYLNHAQPESGLMSAIATEAFAAEDLIVIPEDVSFATAWKLAPEKIVDLVKQTMELYPNKNQLSYDDFLAMCKAQTGFDFEKDYIDAIDGSFWAYTDPSLTSPKFVAAAKIKDSEKFAEVLQASIGKLREVLQEQGQQLQEEQKGKNTFYLINTPQGQTISFSLIDDYIYLSNSTRGITSHLRRKKRTKGKLASTQRMKNFEAEAQSDGYKGIIGVSTYDLAGAFEVGLPMAGMMLGQYSNRDVFDFTFEDVPNVGVLINGLRPNTTAFFRTDTGIAVHSVHDFPIGIESATSGILVGMLLPAVQQVRAAARRVQSENNMRMLGLALHEYQAANQSFPPSYSVDEDGKPLHSWRVLILPYLDQQELYDQFKLDEPWDSPHNSKLAAQMPEVFDHPGLALEDDHTAYLVPLNDNSIISDGPVDDAGHGNKIEDVTDGTSFTTMLVAASQNRSVLWTAPEDLRIDDLNDVELAESLYGYLSRFTYLAGDGASNSIDLEEFDLLDRDKIRGSFRMSDGVSLDLAP